MLTMENKRFLLSLIATAALGSMAQAQAEATAATATSTANTASDTFLMIGVAVVLGAVVTLFYLLNTMIQVQKLRLMQEHGIEVMQKAGLMNREPAWRSMYRWAVGTVPLEQEKDIMLDHDYDGIHELDNSLPPWWVAMFYASIVFAVVYFGYYHVTGYGISSSQEYAIEMEQAQEAIDEYLAKQANRVDESNVEMLSDEKELAAGQAIYTANCAVCHGQQGEGGIGPNMADAYWIHGGDIKDVFKVIKYGVVEKGMIAWQTQMRAADMHRVASYILTLQGTNPPNQKEAQGELYQPQEEVAPTAQDSTAAGEQMGAVEN